jgi:hypothetical protein
MRTGEHALRVLGIIIGLLGATITQAGVITYHPERAILGGNGCSTEGSTIEVNEFGDLEIHYDAMMMAFSPQSTLMADRRSCAVRIPVSIPRGFYVRSIEQRLAYAVAKSADTQASLATRLSLAGLTLSPYIVTLPYGEEFYSDVALDTRRDDVGTDAHMRAQCRSDRSEETMLQLNTAISGQRDNHYGELYIQTGDTYIGEGYEIDLAPCP